MCRTPDDVKFFGRAQLGDPTAGMTDSEQAAYWRASRDRMAAQNMELAAKLDQARKALEPFALAAIETDGTDRWPHHEDNELVESSDALVDLTAGDFRRAALFLSRSDS